MWSKLETGKYSSQCSELREKSMWHRRSWRVCRPQNTKQQAQSEKTLNDEVPFMIYGEFHKNIEYSRQLRLIDENILSKQKVIGTSRCASSSFSVLLFTLCLCVYFTFLFRSFFYSFLVVFQRKHFSFENHGEFGFFFIYNEHTCRPAEKSKQHRTFCIPIEIVGKERAENEYDVSQRKREW